MECKRYEPWSADKVLGALDARRDAELTAHLAGCSRCRAALDREQLLFAAIHRGVAKSVEPSPSPEMAARIRERVTTEVAAERDERRSQTAAAAWLYGSRRWVPVAVAAALVLALGSLWMMHRRGGEHPEATRPAVARSAAPTGQPLPAIATDRASGVQPKRGPFPLKRTVTARAAIRGTLEGCPELHPLSLRCWWTRKKQRWCFSCIIRPVICPRMTARRCICQHSPSGMRTGIWLRWRFRPWRGSPIWSPGLAPISLKARLRQTQSRTAYGARPERFRLSAKWFSGLVSCGACPQTIPNGGQR